MRKVLLFLCALLLGWHCYAQTGKVEGTIKGEKGQPLEGVSVKVKGTTKGTMTDPQGGFSLSASSSSTLEITYVGYISQDYKLNGKTRISLTLTEASSSLSDMVVIGYQKVTRKKTTAAISSISGKEIANLPAASFDQLMQGRLSGVNVQNFSGDPGATPTVTVRGNSLVSRDWDEYKVTNSPLYVVDGVPQPNEDYVGPGVGTGMNYLGGVNPNDIESIDVLKDASAAAIYGSRAANGVILITTKKGKSGAPKVILSGYGGLTQRPALRDVTLGATERRQKLAVFQNQLTYAQQQQLPSLITDSLNPAYNGNTDWQDLFYQTGNVKNADLSLTGGGDGGMNYRFSAGYYDEQGIVKATGFKRYSLRLNLYSKAIGGKLEINPMVYYTRTDRQRGNGETGSAFSLSAGSMPSSLFNLDDNKKEYILGAYNSNLDKNIGNQLSFNLNLGYTFNQHLKFNSLNAYIYNTSRRDFNRTNELQNGLGNYAYTYDDSKVDILSSNYLSYGNSFGLHNLNMIVGSDVQYDQFQNTIASGYNGPSDQIQVVQGFKQTNITAASDYQAYGLLSYYARLAYDFNSKYLFSFAARRDGSSRFGENSKWGFFPSASAAWLLSEENFLKNNNSISLLKIRASLGTSGSLPPQNYLQYNLYNVNAGGYDGNRMTTDNNGGNGYPTATSYNGVTAITPNFTNGAAQKGLSWEKSKQWNLGLDVELFKGKYSASLDFYNKESSLQLFSVNLPVTSGYDYALTNSVGVRNAGVDLTIAANPLPAKSEFKWFSRLNISYNKNAVMNLPNGGRDLVFKSGDRFDKSHILSVGKPINTFYLYQTLGVYATDNDVPSNPHTGTRYRNGNGTYSAGDFQFADLDGDYFIDVFNDGLNPDKMPIGDPNPKFTGGWTNNFTWKNFTLGVFCTFTFKRDILNLYEADLFSNSTDGDANNNFVRFSTPDYSKVNIWQKPGDVATYAKPDIGTYRYYYTSAQTFFLEKGDYLRIKSVSLSYELNPKTLKKLNMDRVKVFGIIDNLAMFQRSNRIPDAENVNPYGEYNGAGYPIPKKFTVGIELQF